MRGDIYFVDGLQLLGSEDKIGSYKEREGAADDKRMPEKELHRAC